MKNFSKGLIIIAVISAVLFSSCKKPKEPDYLLGAWTYKNIQLVFTPANPVISALIQFVNIDDYVQFPSPLTFNEDGTGSGVVNNFTTQFKYTKTDSQITLVDMASYIGGTGDLTIDYQLLDNNKTLQLTADVTAMAIPLLQMIIDNSGFSVSIDGIERVDGVITYTK